MGSALILTYAPVTEEEKELINLSNCLKICVNYAPYACDYRIINDEHSISDLLNTFPEDITVRAIDKTISDNPRVIYDHELYFWGGTITAAVSLAIKQGAKDILLVADNTVHTKHFQDDVNKGINYLKRYANLYQYSNGNFDLEKKELKEFTK